MSVNVEAIKAVGRFIGRIKGGASTKKFITIEEAY